VVDALRSIDPDLRLIERDLATSPLPHPDESYVVASLKTDAQRTERDRRALDLSEQLIRELEQADLLLVSTPIHNFTAPSALKAWLDYIVRPNRTFRSTAAGKVGLLRDRPVLVVAACGGRFGDDYGAQEDFLGPYLRYVFGAVGLSSVEIFRLEKLNRGERDVQLSMESADRWIEKTCVELERAWRRQPAFMR
jgi:FMN-dependent NADH-azoreductase